MKVSLFIDVESKALHVTRKENNKIPQTFPMGTLDELFNKSIWTKILFNKYIKKYQKEHEDIKPKKMIIQNDDDKDLLAITWLRHDDQIEFIYNGKPSNEFKPILEQITEMFH